MIVECSETPARLVERDDGVRLKINKKCVFNEIRATNARLVATAENLVQSFILRERKVKTSRTPREHFVMEQSCRTAYELFCMMTRNRLGFDDVREDLENLASLFDYLVKDTPRAAAYLSNIIRRLILVLEDLISKIEELSWLPPTQWCDVRAHYEHLEAHLEKRATEVTIPQMYMIQGDVLLGAGGFGAVYKARFARTIPCTVKLVKGNMFDMDKYACVDKVVASMINHPLLVRYHASFAIHEAFVTIMEYIRGVDLEKVVHTENGLPMRVLRPLCAQLGMATQYLHFKGFMHGDIKPSNLMITHSCALKMIDFDTVKICIGMFSRKRLRSYFRRTFTEFNDRESAGTMNYHPPEFFKVAAYGRAVDWWAVGATIYEMCFGKIAFRGANDDELEANIRAVNFKFPRKGPRETNLIELKDLVARLLKGKPSARLCSRGYSEFLAHPFLEGLDLHSLERGDSCINFEGVLRHMQPSREGVFSPKVSATLQLRRREYLEPEKQKDLGTHCPLFTFVSGAFQSSVAKVLRDETVFAHDSGAPPELGIANYVDTELAEIRSNHRKFEQFSKRCCETSLCKHSDQ